jgi:tyrosyl-tRNA synthetase
MRAGIAVTILIADYHAELCVRSRPGSTQRIAEKTTYYEIVLKSMIELLAPEFTPTVRIVRGSSFQTSHEYVTDLFRASRVVMSTDAQKTGSDNMKTTGSVAGSLYPIMQMLDEQYLDADIFCGGIDQQRISAFSRRMMPKLGYRPRIHLLAPLIVGIRRESLAKSGDFCNETVRPKMSASDPTSRIGVLDTPDEIRRVIDAAYCGDEPHDNSLIEICQGLGLKNGFIIPDEQPAAIKARIADEIIELLAPLRTDANLAAQDACEYRF